ncbi:hypothetical protein G9A89_023256, partial [Geosiphon pyriformis]
MSKHGLTIWKKPSQLMDEMIDFELAKLKANHVQAVNLVMNKLSKLNTKLEQFNQLDHQVDHTANAKIITTNEMMKTLIDKINDFLFEVNSITALIKVLNTQKLQLSYDNLQTQIPATSNAKVKNALSNKILAINLPKPVKTILISNPDAFFDIL